MYTSTVVLLEAAMGWADLAKVMSGVVLAIALIAGGSFYAVQTLISQFTTPPPKPLFPNDKPASKVKTVSTTKANPVPAASPKPSAKPSPQKEAEGYKAKIVLSTGLNLRQEPSRDSERIGGVDYNEEVTVLEESSDGEWEKVRLEESGVEGWIKSGYTDRIN